jgi:uncharacterized protein YndB with AHSA1/START domain
MRYETRVAIHARPEVVWAVLAEVERWPEWTPSMTLVRRLEDGPFGVGNAVLVRQPRLARAIYTVTEYEPGRAFTWATRSPGLTTVGGHRVVSREDGHATVRLTLDQTGVLAKRYTVPQADRQGDGVDVHEAGTGGALLAPLDEHLAQGSVLTAVAGR